MTGINPSRANEYGAGYAELRPEDLKRIVLLSKLDLLATSEYNKTTTFKVVRYAGKRFKIRAYLNRQAAKRQKSLLDQAPQLFAKCFGQFGRFLILEYVEGSGHKNVSEEFAALGHFIAEIAKVKTRQMDESDFDSWCDDLLKARIFTLRTISLVRRYYVEAQKLQVRWRLGYFDAMPANFVFKAGRPISIDEKHLRLGPEGISLIKPQSKLPSEAFSRILNAYCSTSHFDRFDDLKYREFLTFYYLIYGLAVVGAHKKQQVNIGIRDFHLRRRRLLRIVNASRLLCLREESLWLIKHYSQRVRKGILRPVAKILRRLA